MWQWGRGADQVRHFVALAKVWTEKLESYGVLGRKADKLLEWYADLGFLHVEHESVASALTVCYFTFCGYD